MIAARKLHLCPVTQAAIIAGRSPRGISLTQELLHHCLVRPLVEQWGDGIVSSIEDQEQGRHVVLSSCRPKVERLLVLVNVLAHCKVPANDR